VIKLFKSAFNQPLGGTFYELLQVPIIKDNWLAFEKSEEMRNLDINLRTIKGKNLNLNRILDMVISK